MDNLEKLRNMAEIQASEGNYDYNSHMYGVHVGLQLALNIMETGGEAEPTMKDRPEMWREDKNAFSVLKGISKDEQAAPGE